MDMARYIDLFFSETREHLSAIEESLARLLETPSDQGTIHELYRHAHSIKGMAASMGYAKIAELSHGIEDAFDRVKKGALVFDPAVKTAVARAFDHVERMIARVEAGEGAGSDIDAHLETLRALGPATAPQTLGDAPAGIGGLDAAGWRGRVEVRFGSESPVPAARAEAVARRLSVVGRVAGLSPSLADLAAGEFHGWLFAILETRESPERVRAALEGLEDVESVRIVPEDAPRERRPKDASPGPPATTAQPRPEPPGAHTGDSGVTIRISTAKLDRFLDTIGELIVHRNRLDGRVRGRVDRETDATLEGLRKVTSRLREDVMTLRMLPFETITHRFVRSVRELSDSLHKTVSLRITGRDVQLDRSVLDELVDPINHILRNAVDHGVESPGARRAQAKPERATITIAVERSGETVVVRIEDDGRGMDPEKIKRVALEKGFIDSDTLHTLSDADALMLSTIPGISTAGRITDVSGRGVGMDVVRTRVESLGGRLILRSSPGAGTTVEMRLPLTIVVVPAFIVEAAGRCWAVPVSTVARTIQVAPGDVQRSGKRDWINLREGRTLLLDLASVLGIDGGASPFTGQREALVACEGERAVAVAVDRIIDKRETVVRPLKRPLEELREYSGATILENGRIALILDLLNLAGI